MNRNWLWAYTLIVVTLIELGNIFLLATGGGSWAGALVFAPILYWLLKD